MTITDTIATSGVKLGRKYFRDTWVHRLPLTGMIYDKVVGTMDIPDVIDFRGVKIAVATKDRTITPTLVTGDYEKVELDCYLSVIGPGMTVIDVGANSGVHTALAAQSIGPDGRVFSIEAVPSNVALLEQTVALSPNRDSVTVIGCAAGAEKGEVRIYLDGDNSGTHSVGGRSDQYVDVSVVSLDDLCAEHKLDSVDVVKIDVEGYENHVLDGAVSLLHAYKPILFIEYDNVMIEKAGGDPAAVVDVLRNHGFLYNIDERSQKISGITADELLDYKSSHSAPMARNIVVVPPERADLFAAAL